DLIDQYQNHNRKTEINTSIINKEVINVAIIGIGSFASNVHLPNLKKLSGKYKIYAIADRKGHKAKSIAEFYNANYATTNIDEVLNDQNVDLILICTRHDSHAKLVLKALQKGKHVFVEKPLATNPDDLKQIESFYKKEPLSGKPMLMVGFNRRFSPYATEIKKQTDQRINPLFIHYRMNAGFISNDHWVHENGGRIVGEACHIIDLMTFFVGKPIVSISYESLSPSTEYFSSSDNKSIILKYEDGSIATIEYFAVGNREFPKEYMEIHFDGKSIVLDDYKEIKGYGCNVKEVNSTDSKKGHIEELENFYECLVNKRKEWPIHINDLVQTTKTSLIISKIN
ncbi:MAG: Gfo/Idh/MocA family oxidoreductase, partial [Bacteroidales bacterium]|nr:Gfo/Idh/MocA family oxidoreductase [Bacteroidales bacterium]